MPKRSRNEDPNQTAYRVVRELTGDDSEEQAPASTPPAKKRKNPAAVALGRKGGRKGGPARARKMTPEERSASARKAAEARWRKNSQS
jgi:hypothetical protein